MPRLCKEYVMIMSMIDDPGVFQILYIYMLYSFICFIVEYQDFLNIHLRSANRIYHLVFGLFSSQVLMLGRLSTLLASWDSLGYRLVASLSLYSLQ